MGNERAADRYMMGRSVEETARLRLQARVLEPATRRFLADAGIAPGMRVLDVGSGAGDVALLAAECVGPQGAVIGMDHNPAVLETARGRARAAGLANVTFLEGDLADAAVGADFDAVVGRLILVHVKDPVASVRALAGRVRAGGIVAFQEIDFTLGPAELRPSPVSRQSWDWPRRLAAHTGMELAMGFKLYGVFLDAGLPGPEMRLDAALGGGPDWAGYGLLADTMRSLTPLLLRFGIATAEEIDTYEERLRAEVVAQRGVVMLAPLVSAWARKP